jgi:hypothetical protein
MERLPAEMSGKNPLTAVCEKGTAGDISIKLPETRSTPRCSPIPASGQQTRQKTFGRNPRKSPEKSRAAISSFRRNCLFPRTILAFPAIICQGSAMADHFGFRLWRKEKNGRDRRPNTQTDSPGGEIFS